MAFENTDFSEIGAIAQWFIPFMFNMATWILVMDKFKNDKDKPKDTYFFIGAVILFLFGIVANVVAAI